MRTLEALEQKGYAVDLDGDQIRVKYQGEGRPDPSTIKPLMEDLKQHKPEALTVLRGRETSRIFGDAMRAVSADWMPGLLEHTRIHHSETWELIQQAEEALENTWRLTLQGKLTMTDFREAVSIWTDAYRLTTDEHQRGCDDHR